MISYLKDRILLFVIVIAGDWVSLSTLIKADAIRQDAITTAIVVSLLPSIVISLVVEFFLLGKIRQRTLIMGGIVGGLACWILFVVLLLRFNTINDRYGKIPYPINRSSPAPRDSIIIGGCTYTAEAQPEVDSFAHQHRTLTFKQLFDDFGYNIAEIWSDEARDCARTKILKAFALMLFFLIAGITITTEIMKAILSKQKLANEATTK
jgi:hypothetical protein